MRIERAFGLILCVLCGIASADMTDFFESYTLNTWPSPLWVADGNAGTDSANNRVELDPTGVSNKVLKLHGVTGGNWAALAYYPVTFTNEYVLEVSVYTGSEDIMSGNQPVRGAIGMRSGTYWWHVTNPGRGLLWFNGNGTITGGDGTVLTTYETEQWYDVSIHYTRKADDVLLEYWLDGAYLGAVTSAIWDQSVESSFDHIDLAVGGGSAYFDNIRLSTIPVPGAIVLGLIGTTAIGWMRRRRTL